MSVTNANTMAELTGVPELNIEMFNEFVLKDKELLPMASPTSVIATPIEKTSVIATPIERDQVYYDELAPTSLFKLLEDLEWKQVCSNVNVSPHEVKQWVVRNDADMPNRSRLPIHIACTRKPPAEIIATLIDYYPDSTSQKDNDSRVALHYAILQNADVDVIYLLLDSNYDVKTEQDFWGKSPVDYAFSRHDTKPEILEALQLTKQEVASVAAKIRACEEKFTFNAHRLMNESSTSSKHQKSTATVAMETLLETELSQTQVEVDMAIAQRDDVMEKEKKMMEYIKQLEGKVISQEREIADFDDMKFRNTHLALLLDKYDQKHAQYEKVMAEKDATIKRLKDEAKADKAEAEKRFAELNKTTNADKEKMASTIEILVGKLKEVMKTREIRRSDESISLTLTSEEQVAGFLEYKAEVEEKMMSLEELVVLYRTANRELEERCEDYEEDLELAVDADHRANISVQRLLTSENTRNILEKRVATLQAQQRNSKTQIETLEGLVKMYKGKMANLEKRNQ